MEKTYTLNDIAMMTGFTDRTLRTYLKQGLLEGEKISGTWQFSAEAVDAFFAQPYVKEGLRIKHSSAVFDFLADRKKKTARSCAVLDIPCTMHEGKAVSDFFCEQMEHAADMEFNFHWDGGVCRVILSGAEEQILAMMENYRAFRQG
jgi:hypothetical protein